MAEKKFNFEDGLKELEGIVKKMETNEISLDDSVTEFQKGMELSVKLQKKLDEVENKIKILVKKSDGSTELKDFSE